MLVKNAYAQTNASAPANFSDIEEVVGNFVSAIMGFVAIVLFIMIVVGGYKYLTSGGNPDAAAGARKTITYAVAGILLIAASYLILVIIGNITGANVTNFQIIGTP
ncbi:MAG: seg [Microgenomates group bacterium GW2011_GWC1_37_12b]|uniref:Integral membrane protein n=1 Tax=Candidatus Woesebacteria bacterium GW2011_GWB1_38_8b TaxID=1618571 RepID=A0A0G0L5U0_9BACT|nr:MAG: seg [Microgenomates group bacterium GW2011_GWC1_37_12b]KKQ86397.1 MAG: hypothetical protein UT10_C0026G0021 [Candidatus Woesebacteria bacterium GW2011_GWB1_38_8b]